jgi:serine/threonine protein kinase
MTGTNIVLLSDFGLATLTQSSSSPNKSGQGTAGTIAYMAPEQIEGHARAASDQYALGVVVYEWLCGERPFEGSVTEVMVQHLSLPPPPLRERVPAILAEVEQVVLQALVKDPRERFTSVQAFAVALEEAGKADPSGQTQPVLAASKEIPAYGGRGQPRKPHPAPLYSVKELIEALPESTWQTISWREGTKGTMQYTSRRHPRALGDRFIAPQPRSHRPGRLAAGRVPHAHPQESRAVHRRVRVSR